MSVIKLPYEVTVILSPALRSGMYLDMSRVSSATGSASAFFCRFPQETAQVLEYWLDVSLFSNWKEPHIELPWYPDVCREDIEVYGKRGIRNFTSFGVYMDGPYMKKFPNVQDSIREYSQILAAYQPGKQDEK